MNQLITGGGHHLVASTWSPTFGLQDESAWWYFNLPLGKISANVNWDDELPNIWKNQTGSKPPPRNGVSLAWSKSNYTTDQGSL